MEARAAGRPLALDAVADLERNTSPRSPNIDGIGDCWHMRMDIGDMESLSLWLCMVVEDRAARCSIAALPRALWGGSFDRAGCIRGDSNSTAVLNVANTAAVDLDLGTS